jgi:hypothetical protein
MLEKLAERIERTAHTLAGPPSDALAADPAEA